MKHPDSEDWMTLLYGEASPKQKSKLTAHLSQCAACSAQVTQWRQGMTSLDVWPNHRAFTRPRFRPVLKWAAAAALIVGVGFAAGRFSSPASREIAAVKASLRAEFQQQLTETRTGLLAELVQAQGERREADLKTIYAAIKLLEAKRQEEHATLRKELETVAVTTENSLVQLAGGHLPASLGQ